METNYPTTKNWGMKEYIILLSCFFIPVIPYYFIILENGASIYFHILVIGIAILFCGGIKTYKLPLSKWFVAYSLLTAVIYLLNKNITEAIIWIITIASLYALINSLNTERRFIFACDCLIVMGAFCAFFAIVESFTGFNVFEILNTANLRMNLMRRFGMVRVLSFTGQSINFGITRAFIGALITYRLSFERKSNKRKFFVVSFVLNVMAVMLSLSRLGILTFIASQILILCRNGVKKTVFKVFKYSLILVLILALVSALIPPLKSPIHNITSSIIGIFNDDVEFDASGDGSLNDAYSDRFSLYEWTWSKMKGKELLGHGVNARFTYSYRTDNGQYSYIRVKDSLEVQYLVWLYQQGIIGLIVNLCFIFILLYNLLVKRMRICSFENKLGFNWVMLSILLPYYIGLFGVNMSSEKPMYLVFIAMIIAYNVNFKAKRVNYFFEAEI